jgi:ABC-type Co2+ transport system permease subunit
MDTLTFIGIWILLSFPIVRNINKRLEEDNKDEQIRLSAGFQLYLFIRAQFHVPTFYLIHFIGLFLPNKKD